jgi:hypothetical protein
MGQMKPRELDFEALDNFLGLQGDRPPWVLVDLDIWVDGEGVPEDLAVEIERSALRAFRLCTRPDEWIYAWEAVDEYSDWLYRFWPHRATEPVDWKVSFYPDGWSQVFNSFYDLRPLPHAEAGY